MRLRPGNDIFNEGKLSLKGHLREKTLGHLQCISAGATLPANDHTNVCTQRSLPDRFKFAAAIQR
jgi:hypothetical protein